jgi:hypothetical protein
VIYFQVFNAEEENLESYFKKASDIYYSLSTREVQKYAYEYAVALNRKILKGWSDTKMAGAKQFAKFLKRHKSLTRVSSFKKTNVNAFLTVSRSCFIVYRSDWATSRTLTKQVHQLRWLSSGL